MLGEKLAEAAEAMFGAGASRPAPTSGELLARLSFSARSCGVKPPSTAASCPSNLLVSLHLRPGGTFLFVNIRRRLNQGVCRDQQPDGEGSNNNHHRDAAPCQDPSRRRSSGRRGRLEPQPLGSGGDPAAGGARASATCTRPMSEKNQRPIDERALEEAS